MNFVSLSEVCTALRTALSDRPFVTRGYVAEAHRVRGSCYFTLIDGDARLSCALLRSVAMETDFWVTMGQVVEVTGYAECFRGKWQLRLVKARSSGDSSQGNNDSLFLDQWQISCPCALQNDAVQGLQNHALCGRAVVVTRR